MIYNDFVEKINKIFSDAIENACSENKKRVKAEDYMCKHCEVCLFYGIHNMGMDGVYHLCKAIPPFNDYFDAHLLKWVSARDCELCTDINLAYHRDCPFYVSFVDVLNRELKKIKQKNNKVV